ncbi:hypothetical protein [Desulfobacter sp.]|uniref:hypothetical protein n=1 Tax=Desulfobacter sp. TaxID=2294 RepID=UPI002580C798|nr:hypothetical protein [Desulfobacter sp.]
MKVREIQEHLSKLDPELEVVCYSEDERLLVEKRDFILFDILAVNSTNAKRLRLEDGTPYLKFEKGPDSAVITTIEVTADF